MIDDTGQLTWVFVGDPGTKVGTPNAACHYEDTGDSDSRFPGRYAIGSGSPSAFGLPASSYNLKLYR